MRFKMFSALFIFAFFVECSQSQKLRTKEQLVMAMVMKSLSSLHYAPKEMNDKFSKSVFKEYIKRIDYDKRFLLASDVRTLKKFEVDIDDQVEHGSLLFLKKAQEILMKRKHQAKGFYEEVLQGKFNLQKKETIESDSKKRKYCNSLTELKNRWRKIIKYQLSINYLNKLKLVQGEKKLPNLNAARKVYPENTKNLKVAKTKLKKTFDIYFKRAFETHKFESFSMFLNVMTTIFDPHTNYMAPRNKQDFDISISGQLEGIGALLRESEGFIKVVRIIPGSASSRQKQLKADDVILKVAQGKGEPVDIVGARISDAVTLIRGKKGTEVRLTIKKPDGRIVIIPIVRDVVIVEETYAKSAIVDDKRTGKRIGYIFLPKFYHNFNQRNGRNSADDIRAELVKLNEEHVDGIILDFRNNGGGALDDAVRMGGLFIKEGPIVQVKPNDGSARVLNDPDPDIVYDGPLVVMINRLSASASEIVAGALKDYHRAVLVGADQTFGKGTVQNIINLDKYARGLWDFNKGSLGALKYTMQKFYRINGASTQYEGVKPHIVLPDKYGYLDIGEKSLDYSMSWDTIDPLEYSTWNSFEKKLSAIIINSKKRQEKNENLRLVKKRIGELKKRKDETSQSLRIGDLIAKQSELEKENKKYETLDKERKYLIVSRPKIHGKFKKVAKQTVDSIKEWHKQIRKDTYLDESLLIINDMIDK